MIGDRLSEIHEVIKDPLRQRILLKLGQYNSQDFDDLSKNLKITNTHKLSNQLAILQEMRVEGEYLVAKQENAYALTEKGHEVLTKIIAFPQLKYEDYKERLFGEQGQSKQSKPRPKWFTHYWIAIVISTIIVGVTLPLIQQVSFQTAIIFTGVTLVAEFIAYYGRVKPSITLNRVMYILIGFPIGFVMWFIIVYLTERTFYPQLAGDSVLFIGSMIVCLGIGAIIGDFIGRLRHYKGPEQYSP